MLLSQRSPYHRQFMCGLPGKFLFLLFVSHSGDGTTIHSSNSSFLIQLWMIAFLIYDNYTRRSLSTVSKVLACNEVSLGYDVMYSCLQLKLDQLEVKTKLVSRASFEFSLFLVMENCFRPLDSPTVSLTPCLFA